MVAVINILSITQPFRKGKHIPELRSIPGELTIIPFTAYDMSTSLYPQAKLYNSSGTLVTTVNLSHIANGNYQGTYTPDGSYKFLSGSIIAYTDSGHTVVGAYDPVGISLFIDYNSAGSFGGGGATLNIGKQDYEAIAKIVADLLLPELEKKSEFNVQKDRVLVNFSGIENILKDFATKLNVQARAIQEISNKDNSGLVNKISSFEEKMNGILKTIKGILPELETGNIKQELETVIREVKNATTNINAVSMGIDVTKIEEELVVLERMLEMLHKENMKKQGKIEAIINSKLGSFINKDIYKNNLETL